MTTILFDLFGTLVSYSASRTEQGYPRSAAVLAAAGCSLGADEWLATWAAVSEDLDRQADATGIEFSMADAYRAFAAVVDLDPDDTAVAGEFVACYLDEWSAPVRVVPGAPEMLARLAAAGHRNIVVSNTHDVALVHRHLDTMNLLAHLAAVVTSVEVGYRKPRPEIYAAALDPFGVDPAAAVFVGDTFVADYAGPTALGMTAHLIVPDGAAVPAGLPPERRLASVLDLEARLDDPRP